MTDADPGRGGHRRRDPAERRRLHAEVEDVGEVLDAAARFLEARPRSVSEVGRRLTAAGYPAPLVEAALGRLTELGYLDDAAFARAWVESRDRARPRGERALRQELRVKGIDRALIDRVLDERRASWERGQATAVEGASDALADATDADADAAARLLQRHAGALARVTDPRRRRQRAYALLARNGFDPDVCSSAVRSFLADPADG